jgi:hypothetical protein
MLDPVGGDHAQDGLVPERQEVLDGELEEHPRSSYLDRARVTTLLRPSGRPHRTGRRRGSRVALALGIALIILDGVAQIVVAVSTLGQGTPPVGPIVMRVLLLLALFRAYGAMAELQRDKARPAAR